MARGAGKLDAVQALRGIAALLVVVDHSLLGISAWHAAPRLQHFAYFLGELGVCVFFVISGFIMLHTAGEEYQRPGASGRFIRRRLERIAPIHWLATALAVVKETAARRPPGLVNLLSSAAFLPMADGSRPVHTVGWTLNFEMFFYAAFALTLALPRRVGLWAIAGGFIGLAAIGLLVPDETSMLGFWSRPIILFFAAGVGLRWLRDRIPAASLPAPAALSGALLLAACGCAWAFPASVAVLPALAVPVVALTVLTVGRPVGGPFRALGDASYSLYLFHPFAVSLLLLAWRRYLGEGTFPVYVAVAIAASLALGLFMHAAVERPVEALFRRWRPQPPVAYSPGRTG